MNRRWFLKLLGAAPVAAALPAIKFPTAFGLAPLKAEGTSVAFDYADIIPSSLARSMMRTKERAALRPGLDKFYSATYAEFKPKDLF